MKEDTIKEICDAEVCESANTSTLEPTSKTYTQTKSCSRFLGIKRCHIISREYDRDKFIADQNYRNGKGLISQKKYQQAFYLLHLAEQAGNPNAQYQLGVMYYEGHGTNKNYSEAKKYFELSINNRYEEDSSHWYLGSIYENGGFGVEQNLDTALDHYKFCKNIQYKIKEVENKKEELRLQLSANNAGNTDDQIKLAKLYETGLHGVNKNPTESLKYFKMAADQANVDAQIELAKMYETGLHGVNKNPTESVKYFKMAADQGNVDAQIELGEMYENGYGVWINLYEALKYYQDAKNNGFECNSSIERVKGINKIKPW